MTNELMISLYLLLALMVGITVCISYVQRGMRRVSTAFHLFSGCILCWLVGDIAYFASTSPGAIMFLYNLKIPFVAFASVCVFVLVLQFYQLERYLTQKVLVGLCVVPAITTVLALTSLWHPLLRSQQAIVAIQPLHVLQVVRGPWYWVHMAYSYLLIAASVVVVLVQHRKLPSGYRAPSFVLVLAMVITIAGNMLHFLPFIALPFDVTLVGMSLSQVFIYVAVASSSRTDLLEIARDEIFNFLDEYVFILDLKRRVMDANQAARRWLADIGIPARFPLSFVSIFDALRAMEATIRESDSSEAGTDIYYTKNEQVFVFNLRQRFVLDKKGKPVGVYATLFDITRYRTLIDELVKTVDVDPLTGIANRKVFEEHKLRYEGEKTMPLSVILGDANGLKRVNDELGHQEGDRLLKLIAQQLAQCCPHGGVAARIGGDEFAMFLPGHRLEEAKWLIDCIERGLEEKKGYPFRPSIALGAAERQGTWEAVEQVVRRADVEMYSKKENDRRH